MGAHLSYYLGRLFLCWFAGVLGSFFLVIFLFDFFEFQRRTAFGKSLPFWTKLGLLCLKTPYILEQVMPFLIFLAALGLLWRLNRGNEILVLRSFGISSWRIASPFFLIALIFGALNLTVFQPLSVGLLTTYQKKEKRLLQKNTQAVFQVLPSGFWIKKKHKDKQLIYHIQNVQEKTSVLEGVSVYIFRASHEFDKRYDAEEGRLQEKEILLKNVWVVSCDRQATYAEHLVLPFSLTVQELYNRSPSPQVVSFWALPSLIQWMRQGGMAPYKYEMELERLWALTFWFAGMVLLAVACGIRSQKRGGALVLLIFGLVGSLALYFIRDVTYALGGARYLPMILAAWSPCVLTFLVALVFLFFWEEGQRSRPF